jgi:hypothetical protein
MPSITVAMLKHAGDRRSNIPTAEFESVMADEEKLPIPVIYERRNRDLDPQLVWRGKDEQDWSDLVAPAPPLYIQEKVHPKVLVDDLLRQSKERAEATAPAQQLDLFADFNAIGDDAGQAGVAEQRLQQPADDDDSRGPRPDVEQSAEELTHPWRDGVEPNTR